MYYRFARFFLFAIPCAGLLGLVVFSKNKAAVGSTNPRSMTLTLAPDSIEPSLSPERLPSVQLERLPDAGDLDPVSSNAPEPVHVTNGLDHDARVSRFEVIPSREGGGVVTRPMEELPADSSAARGQAPRQHQRCHPRTRHRLSTARRMSVR